MVDIVKEYITDKSELSVAKELIKTFIAESEDNSLKNITIDEVIIKNFGNIPFYQGKIPSSTIVTGSRNSGKSWLVEAILWCWVGSCRSVTGIVGENGSATSVEVSYRVGTGKYRNVRTRKGSKLIVEMWQGEKPLANDADGVIAQVEKIFGVPADTLKDLLYFSPKLSLHFSKKLPNEIEAHLIKLSNNTQWLDLGEHAKVIKKKEADKISEINGIIGYINSESSSKEDIEQNIDILKTELKDLENEKSEKKLPSIDKLKNEMEVTKKKIEAITEINTKIQDVRNADQEVEDAKKSIETCNVQINTLNTDIKETEAVEKEYNQITEEMNDIVSKGQTLKGKIEEIDKILQGGTTCPILKTNCQDLEKNNSTLTDDKNKLVEEKQKLADEYTEKSKKQKELKFQIDKLPEKRQQVKNYEEAIETSETTIKEKKKLAGTDTSSLEAKAAKHGDLNQLERKHQVDTEKYENFAKTIKEISEEINDLTQKISDKKSDISKLEDTLKQFDKHADYIKDKTKLEERQTIFDVLIKKHFGKKGIAKAESSKSIKKINKHLDTLVPALSGNSMTAELDEKKFTMSVQVKGTSKLLDPKLVSDGQEWILNLAFGMAVSLMASKGKIPFFVCDDCLSYQDDNQNSRDILTAFFNFHKGGMVSQMMLVSNRMVTMNEFGKKAEKYIEFVNGEAKE